VSQYYAAFLILEGLMIGVFCALDAILFYVFFEGMLIPMFIIIGVWGGPRRVYASMKFFLYTFLGSVFMLVGLIYLYLKGGSFQLADMAALPLTIGEQTWLFFAFLWRSRSRCRCSRCTRGCRMRTWRRRPAAR
jgi:NADH-quinone oxidoreductase subunit M